jgi:hypothetical protein
MISCKPYFLQAAVQVNNVALFPEVPMIVTNKYLLICLSLIPVAYTDLIISVKCIFLIGAPLLQSCQYPEVKERAYPIGSLIQ